MLLIAVGKISFLISTNSHSAPKASLNFTGREKELSEIKYSFKSRGNVFVLAGMSGIGKTQIAKRYANLNSKNYKAVIWFDASANIISQIQNFLNNKGLELSGKNYDYIFELPDNNVKEVFKHFLSLSNKKYLVIFDNAPSRSYISDFIFVKNTDIIITTKNKLNWDNFKFKEVKKFARKDSIKLLEKITNSTDKKNLNALSELLGDYPLALSQAGYFIKNAQNISISEYIEFYKKERKRLWENEHGILTEEDYDKTVKAALDLSIKQIKQENPKAIDLLKFLSFVRNENIPEPVVKIYFNNDKLLISKLFIILQKYSLLEVTKDDYNNLCNLHETLQIVVQDQLSDSEKTLHIKKVISAFHKTLPTKLDIVLPLFVNQPYFLDHIDKIFGYAQKYNIQNNELIDLRIRKLEYLISEKRDFTSSGSMIDEISTLVLGVNKANKMTLARYQLMKAAYNAWFLGDFKQSFLEAKDAEQNLQHYKSSSEEWLMLYNRLAQNYMLLGEVEKGLIYSDKGTTVITNAKDFVGNQDAYFHIRARLLEDKGDLETACKNIKLCVQKSNEIKNKSKKFSTVNLGTIVHAKILIKLHLYKEALENLSECEKKLTEIFGSNTNFLSVVLDVISAIYWHSQKNNDRALNHLKKTLEKMEQSISQNSYHHRYYALAVSTYGDIKLSQGKHKSAQNYYLKAEEIYKKILTNLAIDDVSYLYKQLALNSYKLNNLYLFSYYTKTHFKLFGKEHDRSIELMKFIVYNNINI